MVISKALLVKVGAWQAFKKTTPRIHVQSICDHLSPPKMVHTCALTLVFFLLRHWIWKQGGLYGMLPQKPRQPRRKTTLNQGPYLRRKTALNKVVMVTQMQLNREHYEYCGLKGLKQRIRCKGAQYNGPFGLISEREGE